MTGINPSVFTQYLCFQEQCHSAFHSSNWGSSDHSTEVILFYNLFLFFLNLEIVNVCDYHNTFIKVLLRRPKRRASSHNWCTCFCPISILRKWPRKGSMGLDYQNQKKKKRRKGALCVCQKTIRRILCQETAFLNGKFSTIAFWGVIITSASLKLPSIVCNRTRSQEAHFRKRISPFAKVETQTGAPSHYRSLHSNELAAGQKVSVHISASKF